MSWFALATYRTAGKGDAPAVVFDNRVYDARQALPLIGLPFTLPVTARWGWL